MLSCGGKIYLNNDYNPPPDRKPVLSVLPVLVDTTVDVKSVFEDIFKDPNAPFTVMRLPRKLYIYEPDSVAITIMLAIQDIEYTPEDLAQNPALYDHISMDDMTYFNEAIGNPDLLLVPARFSLKEIESSVIGKSSVRLYDLHSGKLIFQNKEFADINSGNYYTGGGALGGALVGLLKVSGVGSKVSPKKIDDAVDCTYSLATQAFIAINKEIFNISE